MKLLKVSLSIAFHSTDILFELFHIFSLLVDKLVTLLHSSEFNQKQAF